MRRLLSTLWVLAACGGGGDGTVDGGDGDGIQFIDGTTDGVPFVADAPPGGSPGSLRFFDSGVPNADRVEIRIDPQVPADVGAGDFTIDLWVRLGPGVQLPAACQTGRDGWQGGAIVLDRDRNGDGLHGDFGLSLYRNGVAFGIAKGNAGAGLCGATAFAGGWHHIAVTRSASSGVMTLYLDGVADGSATGPTGDVSYQDGATGSPKDPFLVIGAEKHDLAGYTWLDGFVDELRISTVIRYSADFTPETMPYAAADADTAALYHFDDGGGTTLGDVRGMSPGDVKFGTDGTGNAVPLWVTAQPFLN